MAQTIQVQNYGSNNIKDVLTLDADAAAGVSTFTLKNTDDVAAGDLLVFGQLGSQGSEKLTVQSVTNATTLITTTNSALVHKRFEPVTDIFGDTIRLYRANNVNGTQPGDVSFAMLSSITIDFDELVTSITDAAGNSSYWYKFTYYNATTTSETQLTDSSAQRGGGYGHYATIDEIMGEAFGPAGNSNISTAVVDSRRIDAENEINGELYNVYTLPFGQATGVPVPPLVTQATRLIAAGLLLIIEYGPMTSGGKNRGEDKLSEGRALLERIKTRNLVLTDPAGNTLLLQPLVTSYPNATTDQTGTGRTAADVAATNQDFGPVFRKAQQF